MAVDLGTEIVRWVGRNSSGIPYYVDNGGNVFKGNGTSPTSFTQQDSGNVPAGLLGVFPGGCANNSTHIWIFYRYGSGMTDEIRAVPFAFSTDTYGTVDTGLWTTDFSIRHLVAACDANGIPHFVVNDSVANMGTEYNTLMYDNKVGGSWGGAIEIEGATATQTCFEPDIIFDQSNIPIVSYRRSTSTIRKAVGNANNATSFTLTSLASDVNISTTFRPTACHDSAGDLYVQYIDSSGNLALWDDTSSTKRTSSATDANPTNSKASWVCAVGTDIYCFYSTASSGSNNDLIRYDVFNGTSWAGTTTFVDTGTPNTPGSLHCVKWSNEFNYGSDGTNYNDSNSGIPEIDLSYDAGGTTGNDWWDTLTLSSGTTTNLDVTPASLTISGTNVDLTKNVALTVTPASLTISAPNISIGIQTTLDVTPAALTISGTNVDLTVTTALDVTPAALTISPTNVDLTKTTALSVTPAALTITGTNVDLGFITGLSVTPAALTISPTNVDLTVTTALDVTPAALTISAPSISLGLQTTLDVTPATLTIAAPTIGLTASYNVTVTPGALTASPTNIDLTVTRDLQVTPATLSISAPSIALGFITGLSVTPAALTINAPTIDLTLQGTTNLDVTPAALTISGTNIDLSVTRDLQVTPATLTISPTNIGLTVGRDLTVTPAALTISPTNIDLTVGRDLTVTPAALTINAPTVALGYVTGLSVTPATLSINAPTIGITAGYGMDVTPAALTINAATIDLTFVSGGTTRRIFIIT